MTDSMLTGVFFLFCGVIATTSWVGGAYSIYRGMRALPDNVIDVPFFSNDPRLISPEGVIWRRRIYLCMLWFTVAVAMAGIANYA